MSRIVSITRKKITNETLHNIAVEEDESYIANGVVVHNCKSYIVPNLVGNKNKEVTDKTDKWLSSVAKASSSINLAEPIQPPIAPPQEKPMQHGLCIQMALISKSLAKNAEEAKQFAAEYAIDQSNMQEMEDSYKFIHLDASKFVEGSLKSFEPIEGVELYLGIMKPIEASTVAPQMLAEPGYELQTVIVSKDKAKSLDQAKKIAKDVGAKTLENVDETDSSYRFRQRDPNDFVVSSFRTKAIANGASLVYGKLK